MRPRRSASSGRLHEATPHHQTFSAGFTIAHPADPVRNLREVVRSADSALYVAKEAGRTRACCADDGTLVVLGGTDAGSSGPRSARRCQARS